ncbi:MULTISPECIES: gamma-glutamylcyclotransferase [Mesorhizobium]|uniref:glutathione-specific gamma-glutamylcyclotransferase n=1 Tax=Mesorhizobium denitrificans TaxID=2294114 RepID=A0A371XF20_9HYPH|nr:MULTISPECIES: gamma-glutamylcyclotransferase [Mesorhizobium]RFC67835.1 gamma-glutamylcyclotransferase [Mesorhizobium denitrificans]
MGDFWVFGYGSLIWNPGFAHVETSRARLSGYRRSLCVKSWVHRGTRERPGLVLGLDRGGSCVGLAFRVPGELRDEVIGYLRERELVTNVYLERQLQVRLADGRQVEAVTYVADPKHEQYAGRMDELHAAEIVRDATGQSGANPDYVLSTIKHLEALGIRDHWLERVAAQLA